MKWIEIITVRSTGSSSKILALSLQELVNDVVSSANHDRIRIYQRENIETDICVVLFHAMEKLKNKGSSLGLRLVSALREFGSVNHTVWTEIGHSNNVMTDQTYLSDIVS